MKQLLFIAALALSLVSCTVKTNYYVRNIDHNYTKNVDTSANWHRGQIVEIKGNSFEVLFANN